MTAAEPLSHRNAASAVPDEAESLWLDFGRGDQGAREALFNAYLPFARRIAKRRFQGRRAPDIELADLEQLACTGLLEAIDRFDAAKGAPFEAFASRRINGAIMDGVAKSSELRQQLAYRKRLRAERARSLLPSDVDHLSQEDAMGALIDATLGLAIGLLLDEGSAPERDQRPDPAPNAYESLAWRETIGEAMRALASLPERERSVIRYHYIEGLAFEQIAALLKITKGRVSQIHKAALGRLRQTLRRGVDFRT